MPRSRFLMCKPSHYEVTYEINPWMRAGLERPPDRNMAMRQWQELKRVLEERGAAIESLDQVHGLPDMVFAADEGLVKEDRVLLANFRFSQRRGETEYYRRWFAVRGYKVQMPSQSIFFEGMGDALWADPDRESVVLGFGIRSSSAAADMIKKFGVRVAAELELKNKWFYHLNTCFNIIDMKKMTILYYPAAFSRASISQIKTLSSDLIELSKEDAESFVCNAVAVGKDIVLEDCSRDLADDLANRNFSVVKVDLSEFKKSGGSARCLVLEL